MSAPSANHLGDRHAVRNGIMVATVGGLLASILLEPVRTLVGQGWRIGTGAAVAAWGTVTASVPLWSVIAAAVVGGVGGWWFFGRRRSTLQNRNAYAPARLPVAPRAVDDARLARIRFTDIEDGVLRRLVRADGEWLTLDELGTAKTKQLRLEQALERLGALGLVEESQMEADEPLYGLTAQGRDFVIERGDVR